jgi:hypothetical protein
MEILTMKEPAPIEEEFVRLSLKSDNRDLAENIQDHSSQAGDDSASEQEEDDEDEDVEDLSVFPELRLVRRDDPEAYGFTTPQYSAHKLPRDVVDASQAGPGGMGSFMRQWQDLLAKEHQQQQDESSGDE